MDIEQEEDPIHGRFDRSGRIQADRDPIHVSYA
jgi:hypothetical protein